jgi:hypothetical protein
VLRDLLRGLYDPGVRSLARALTGPVLVLAGAGCGDEAIAPVGGGGGGGGSAAGTGGDDRAYQDLPARSGTVTVYESQVESSRQTGLVGAFLDIVEGDPGSCAREDIAGCEAMWCRGGSVGTEALVDAGVLFLDYGLGSRSMSRNDVTGFYLDQVTGGVLEPGVDVTVDTTGAAVAPFAVALVSPAELTVTSSLPLTGDVLRTDVPFEVGWTAIGSAGVVNVVVRADVGRDRRMVGCRHDVAAGSGAVPPEALAMFVGLDAPSAASISVETRSETTATAGDFPISVAVVVTALAGEGDATRYLAGFAP